jgi:hypothetical protein
MIVFDTVNEVTGKALKYYEGNTFIPIFNINPSGKLKLLLI